MNGNIFTDILYKKEDPEERFEYVQTMLNLELNSGSKYTKLITADPKERVQFTKMALERYQKLDSYIRDYLSFKKISSLDKLENQQMKQ